MAKKIKGRNGRFKKNIRDRILFKGDDRKNPLLFLLNMPFLSEENPALLSTGQDTIRVEEIDPRNVDIPKIGRGF